MPRRVVKDVKFADVAPELTEGLDVEPDEIVRVTVDADHKHRVAALLALAEKVGAEAERNGLTDGKLAELLKDDD